MAAEIDPDARARALAALAGGSSIADAARRSGYARGYLHRLVKEPRFAEELERRRAEIAASPTSPDEELALEVLREIAQEGEVEVARVGAAKAILAHVTAKKPKAIATPAPAKPILLRPDEGDAAARAWLDKTPG